MVSEERCPAVDLIRAGDPILAFAASFVPHTLQQAGSSRVGLLMCEHIVSSIEKSVLVLFATEGLFGIFDEISYARRIAQSIFDRHPCC